MPTTCGMDTERLLRGQIGADGFTSAAPVEGERKTVTVFKAGPSLGLHIKMMVRVMHSSKVSIQEALRTKLLGSASGIV